MTVKQISTLNYILGRLEGLAEYMEESQQQYLLDTCEMLSELLEEDEEWANLKKDLLSKQTKTQMIGVEQY